MISKGKYFVEIKDELDFLVEKYNNIHFIEDDPISIPHQFQKKQDIEIIAFWVSILAWGRRSVIIKKSLELVQLMDGAPHDFILNHTEKDRVRFANFKHRTFQYTDSLYFLDFLQRHYRSHKSLEDAFLLNWSDEHEDIEDSLVGFHNYFFNVDYAPTRTRKHIATPSKKARCKRLSMYLRWMVRKDKNGVDFGLWNRIKMSQLCLPLDVHVEFSARKLGLLTRKQNDWLSVKQLSQQMRKFDPQDPCKYDFALFGMGLSRHDLS